jgi:hypothetical protein
MLCVILSTCGGGGSSNNNTPINIPLTVSSMTQDGIGINESICVQFSKQVEASTINSSSFLVSNNVTGTVTYDPSTYVACFKPSIYLSPSTKYTATITSDVKDTSGNAMNGYYTWNFTTGASTTSGSWKQISANGAPLTWSNLYYAWTGTDIIIFSYDNVGGQYGGKYNPFSDSWSKVSFTNMPSTRASQPTVWTGNEMIVWGGSTPLYGTILNTGGKYNPLTNVWVSTTTVNAPYPRYSNSAVWTGTEMIIWGGTDGSNLFNSGAKYNPNTDTWTPITTVNAPTGRLNPTAFWTGTEMIIWGGTDQYSNIVHSGAKYNPNTDTWTPITTANAPTGRLNYTAVWTGTEMIIWGGGEAVTMATGARYNPFNDTWTATTLTNAPIGRRNHSATWTGQEMIVWGGYTDNSESTCTGGRYNPLSDSWTAVTVTGGFCPSLNAFAIWTGTEMLVAGGDYGNQYHAGGMYTP